MGQTGGYHKTFYLISSSGLFPIWQYFQFFSFWQTKPKSKDKLPYKANFYKVFRLQSFGYISDTQPNLCMFIQAKPLNDVCSLLLIWYPISRISGVFFWDSGDVFWLGMGYVLCKTQGLKSWLGSQASNSSSTFISSNSTGLNYAVDSWSWFV